MRLTEAGRRAAELKPGDEALLEWGLRQTFEAKYGPQPWPSEVKQAFWAQLEMNIAQVRRAARRTLGIKWEWYRIIDDDNAWAYYPYGARDPLRPGDRVAEDD